MTNSSFWQRLEHNYPDLWQRLETLATPELLFTTFKALSDNYSPTLTVSRVQGPLVKSLLNGVSNVEVDANLRRSGSIGIKVGTGVAPVWFSGHADICSYLTEPYGENGYLLTPFCVTRADPGRRPAVALSEPAGHNPLKIIATGDMVTAEDGATYFDTDVTDLPLWTRVVYQSVAEWNQETGEAHGYIDNHASCAAQIVAAQILAAYDINALFVLNDEEEGPVDKGNQGFSRAMARLFNRTPHAELPDLVVVSDTHQQEQLIAAGEPDDFGAGAIFSGFSSGTRGAVTPPQLVAFNRELIDHLGQNGVKAKESRAYISRSDDISAMLYTPNVVLVGAPGTSSHFNEVPVTHPADMAELAKVLVVYALLAQDEEWCEAYL